VNDLDYRLFEEALWEIMAESFPYRDRSTLDEEETWRLHEDASRRVQEKIVGFYYSECFTENGRSTRL
jgi:hypothetical protein